MVAGPAHALAGEERGERARRQRRLACGMPEGIGLARPVLEETAAHRPAQLVALVRDRLLGPAAVIETTLEHEHVVALRHELTRDEARGEPPADDDDGAPLEGGGHQLKSWIDCGFCAAGKGLPRDAVMSCVWNAGRPG